MREAPFLGQFETPDLDEARTPKVEVNVQDLLACLCMRNRDRGRRDRLALARLGRDDEEAMRKGLVTRRVEEIPQARDGLGELRILVLDKETRDLFATLAADVRENSQYL